MNIINSKISPAEKYLSEHLEEVMPYEFYRSIFPTGSFENAGEQVQGKYNGIMLRFASNTSTNPKRITVTDDLIQLLPTKKTENTFSVMSPISYAGKSRKFENARYMYALAIDLDGLIDENRVKNLFWQIENQKELRFFYWGIPEPTYLVSSGTGIHIYYVFDNPIPMYKNVTYELEKLKKRLTWQAWTQGSSSLHDKVQYEPLNQAFRCVGTTTKNHRHVRAFKWKEAKKTSISVLNQSVPQQEQYLALIDEEKFNYKSTLTLAEAKKLYPKWFENRIIKGIKKGTWTCKRDLYDWWKNRLPGEAEEGHRYWCLHMLAIYAIKSGISFEELEKDCYMLQPILDKKSSKDNPFTVQDVKGALAGFKKEYITYPINSIVYRTGLKIEKNKRNGRKQDQHLERARAVQMIDYPNREWINKKGAPNKQSIVKKWKKDHPKGTKAECHQQTKLDPKTIRKWWDFNN